MDKEMLPNAVFLIVGFTFRRSLSFFYLLTSVDLPVNLSKKLTYLYICFLFFLLSTDNPLHPVLLFP